MKKLLITTTLFFFSIIIYTIFSFITLSFELRGLGAYAQNIGINSTGLPAHSSALLDIDASPSNNKGLLMPRIPLTAINVAAPVTSPTISLLVYNTATAGAGTLAVSPGFYYWDGAKWMRLLTGATATDSQTLSLTGNTLTISNGNSITFPTSHYIGETFGGGVICDLWKDDFGVEHGVITSTVDISTGGAWGCNGTLVVGANSQWDGAANTVAIVAACGVGTAAQLCDAYTGAGFTDWYLPSRNEWQTLYSNLDKVNRKLQALGATLIKDNSASSLYPLMNDPYWTSTQIDDSFALIQIIGDFNYTNITNYSELCHKFITYKVRAVRAF